MSLFLHFLNAWSDCAIQVHVIIIMVTDCFMIVLLFMIVFFPLTERIGPSQCIILSTGTIVVYLVFDVFPFNGLFWFAKLLILTGCVDRTLVWHRSCRFTVDTKSRSCPFKSIARAVSPSTRFTNWKRCPTLVSSKLSCEIEMGQGHQTQYEHVNLDINGLSSYVLWLWRVCKGRELRHCQTQRKLEFERALHFHLSFDDLDWISRSRCHWKGETVSCREIRDMLPALAKLLCWQFLGYCLVKCETTWWYTLPSVTHPYHFLWLWPSFKGTGEFERNYIYNFPFWINTSWQSFCSSCLIKRWKEWRKTIMIYVAMHA